MFQTGRFFLPIRGKSPCQYWCCALCPEPWLAKDRPGRRQAVSSALSVYRHPGLRRSAWSGAEVCPRFSWPGAFPCMIEYAVHGLTPRPACGLRRHRHQTKTALCGRRQRRRTCGCGSLESGDTAGPIKPSGAHELFIRSAVARRRTRVFEI